MNGWIPRSGLRGLAIFAFILGQSACGPSNYVQIGVNDQGRQGHYTIDLANIAPPGAPATVGPQPLAPDGPFWSWYGLDQGWSLSQRQAFWFTPQGSWMVPYGWLVTLKQAENDGPFLSPDHMEQLGYIPVPATAGNNNDRMLQKWNPGGKLPLGFAVSPGKKAKDRSGDMAWAGPTCAACHSNMINVKNNAGSILPVMIEGAPSLGNFYNFNESLDQAIYKTFTEKERLKDFVAELKKGGFIDRDDEAERTRIHDELEAHHIWLYRYIERNLCGGKSNQKYCPARDTRMSDSDQRTSPAASQWVAQAPEIASEKLIPGLLQSVRDENKNLSRALTESHANVASLNKAPKSLLETNPVCKPIADYSKLKSAQISPVDNDAAPVDLAKRLLPRSGQWPY